MPFLISHIWPYSALFMENSPSPLPLSPLAQSANPPYKGMTQLISNILSYLSYPLGRTFTYTLPATALVEASPAQPLPISRTKLSCHLCIYLWSSNPHNFAGPCAEQSKEIGLLYLLGPSVFCLDTKATLMFSEQPESLWTISFGLWWPLISW